MSGPLDGSPRPHALPAVACAALACAAPLVTLTGCLPGGSPSELTAAPGATTAACGTALAAAPATMAGLARTPTSVPGALSWGEPAVILRCGLPAQLPTTKRCLGIDTVDWIVDDRGDPITFVSYGRDPAVELRVPASYGRQNAVTAAVDAGPVAAALPANGRSCIGAGDVTPAAPAPASASESGGAAARLSAGPSAG